MHRPSSKVEREHCLLPKPQQMTAFRSVIPQLHCWAGNSFFYHKRATPRAEPCACPAVRKQKTCREDHTMGGGGSSTALCRPGCRAVPVTGSRAGVACQPPAASHPTLICGKWRCGSTCQGAGTRPAQVTLLLACAFPSVTVDGFYEG